ncbi:hypothetical protein [Immundisolibacter sp.]
MARSRPIRHAAFRPAGQAVTASDMANRNASGAQVWLADLPGGKHPPRRGGRPRFRKALRG